MARLSPKSPRRHSDCPDQAGELPNSPSPAKWWRSSEEAIRALEPDQRTGVFTTPLGFHIATLYEKVPPGPAPFEHCRQDIKNVLTGQSRYRLFLRAVEDLRAHADIRFLPDGPITPVDAPSAS